MTEEYSEQLAYVMGEEATSEETPEQPKETETPSETKVEEIKEETPIEEPKEQTPEPEPEPEEKQEEEFEAEEHLTRSQKRKAYIQRIEDENRRLKEAKQLPWEQGEAVELTKEQLDNMIDERVKSTREAEMREQIRQSWVNDYQESVKKYSELDPKSKSYNKELDALLTDLLTDNDGNPKLNLKVSEAYERMKKSLDTAKTQGAENASLKLAEQKAKEAIAPSATGKESNELTWDDMAKLEREDPETYHQMIREGKLPT